MAARLALSLSLSLPPLPTFTSAELTRLASAHLGRQPVTLALASCPPSLALALALVL